jgi:hypothetical protein
MLFGYVLLAADVYANNKNAAPRHNFLTNTSS